MTKSRKHGITGCRILDEAGVTAGGSLESRELCLKCPYPRCVLDRNKVKGEAEEECTLTEKTVQCTGCNNLETITLKDGTLCEARYFEERGKVYHKKLHGNEVCGVCKVFN